MRSIAFVGCAHIHAPNFAKRLQERSDIQVKSVWDHDAERANRYAEKLQAEVVVSVDTIWSDPEIGAVVICAETNRHEPLVMAAAAAGKDLFVEKPLGMGASDAYAMAEAIEKAGVIFQTGYFRRGDPIHIFLREQVRLGNFGHINRFRHANCHAGSLRGIFDGDYRWMADVAQTGGGGFGDLGTHSLDILLWIMGDVERVTANIDAATDRYGDCDEYGEGLIKFKSGAIGSLAAGWVDIANPISIVLSGTEGHAYVCNNNELYFQSEHVAGADGKHQWTDLPETQPHAFDLFLDAIVGKETIPLVTPQEAALRNDVMEALYRGAAEGRWVEPLGHS